MKVLDGFSHIKLCSDLHLTSEHLNDETPFFTDDGSFSESLLVIAGDIAPEYLFVKGGAKSWLARVTPLFHSVVIVLGNHDYWGMAITDVPLLRKEIEAIPNAYLLHNDIIGNEKVKLLGATLWTDLSDPINASQYERCLNDSRFITDDGKPLSAATVYAEHKTSIDFIKEHAIKDTPEQTVLVATHHAPAAASCDPRFKGDALNPSFFSCYDEWIAESPIDYWLHGHTHYAVDYQLGACRVICHPHGYYPEESGITKPLFTVWSARS